MTWALQLVIFVSHGGSRSFPYSLRLIFNTVLPLNLILGHWNADHLLSSLQ